MIDQLDTQTHPLPLDTPIKRKRGRPVTGKAMTPAEKQKAYRERLKARQHASQCQAAGVENNHSRMKEELREMTEKAIHFEARAIALEKMLQEANKAFSDSEDRARKLLHEICELEERNVTDIPYVVESRIKGRRDWQRVGGIRETWKNWQDAEAFVKHALETGSESIYRILPAHLPIKEYK